MSRIARFAVLVASSLSLLSMLSTTAGAVTWDNRGSTIFTATNPATGVMTATGVNLTCHGAMMIGTAPNNVVGTTYSVTGSINFKPCFISGVPTGVNCGFTFTTSAMASPFHGNVDLTCTVIQFNTPTCHISGQTTADYDNPEPAGVSGVFTLAASSTLHVGNHTPTHCVMGIDDTMSITAQTFATTSSNPPTLVRTP
jgi:hypothetical protein